MTDKNDYEIGYGKPPKQHRFQPGKSGNPQGRPKGHRNLKTMLEEEMLEPITLRINGKTVTITTAQALLKHVKSTGFAGNLKAATYLLESFGSLNVEDQLDEGEVAPNDQQIIDDYMRRHKDGGENEK